jgi:G:T-mismatch repair DNA endonuclease (very short patch repair protein)
MTEAAFFEMLAASQKRRPTHPEVMAAGFIEMHDLPWRYTGDGRLWLGRRNPDFVHTTEKIVLEIFGRYWHKKEDEEELRASYSGVGYRLLVLWEDEVTEERMFGLA